MELLLPFDVTRKEALESTATSILKIILTAINHALPEWKIVYNGLTHFHSKGQRRAVNDTSC